MGEAKVGHVDDIEGMHSGVFKPIGSHLGVTAFGVNLEQYPQGHEQYPEHDHANDGQEEVYFVISGRATLTIEDEEHQLKAGSVVYVPSGTKRRFTTPDSPVQFIAIGGAPGAPFTDIIAARRQSTATT
jgi:mannose-6-phosphate isomerase-like protein (cupin superfamily)